MEQGAYTEELIFRDDMLFYDVPPDSGKHVVMGEYLPPSGSQSCLMYKECLPDRPAPRE